MLLMIDTPHDDSKQQVLQQIAKQVHRGCVIVTHSRKQSTTKLASFVAPEVRPRVVRLNLLHFGVCMAENRALGGDPVVAPHPRRWTGAARRRPRRWIRC